MRRFVLVSEQLNIHQQTQIAAYLGEHKFGFWHRLDHVWLIVCPDSASVDSLLIDLSELIESSPTLLVFEIVDWHAYMPASWQEWFEKHWRVEVEIESTPIKGLE